METLISQEFSVVFSFKIGVLVGIFFPTKE